MSLSDPLLDVWGKASDVLGGGGFCSKMAFLAVRTPFVDVCTHNSVEWIGHCWYYQRLVLERLSWFRAVATFEILVNNDSFSKQSFSALRVGPLAKCQSRFVNL